MVVSSRRQQRLHNKTRLLIYRGTDKLDLTLAEPFLWDVSQDATAHDAATKHQHVGAKGVESGELLEHHLQAALSSASLLHSRPSSTRAGSPTSSSQPSRTAAAPKAESSSAATLNYHIPTPDATGVVDSSAYAQLYHSHRYHEPHGYIRFSDTVEESSGGAGGLGYCMDDEDVQWVTGFNSKAEGGSGGDSPLRESKETPGRPKREGAGMKGKEKEKALGADGLQPVYISEETFEYVMGVLEKWTEDNVPSLHTNLALMPTFPAVEHLFSSPIPTSFLPNNEQPKGLPNSKALTKTARIIFPHWKDRRERRKGRTIFPILNYDETNDGDPYVCFRRRDIRATRKTRRTDNFSVERMQKLQVELRSAHALAQMVLRREMDKAQQFKADRDLWEARWKLFETKRRWPSLGMMREEEEMITGRGQDRVASAAEAAAAAGRGGVSMSALQPQNVNLPGGAARKKQAEKEREERDRLRERQEAARGGVPGGAERSGLAGATAGNRSYAPEVLKERMQSLRERLEEVLKKRQEADRDWDDATDASYQPLPSSHASHAFRARNELDPTYSGFDLDGSEEEDESRSFLGRRVVRPQAFRLRRGRGGFLRLDRRNPAFALDRGIPPKTPTDFGDWLFPEPALVSNARRSRPRSIDDVQQPGAEDAEREKDEGEERAKRRRLNEVWRYDVDKGGSVGVGMGLAEDEDRVVVDDLDPKFIRSRIDLLREDDMAKLRPDTTPLALALASFDQVEDMPPFPVFVRPQIIANPSIIAAQFQQQQMLQQQAQQAQLEQFQRFQMMAQQQAMAAQQQMAQQQRDGTATPQPGQPVQMGPPNGQPQNGRPPAVKRQASSNVPNNSNGNGNGNSMPPPAQPRPSVSPTNSVHSNPAAVAAQMNGQSPQMINGMLPPGAAAKFANGQNIDPAMQQRIIAARAQALAQAQAAAQQQQQQQQDGDQPHPPPQPQLQVTPEMLALAQKAGFGNNVPGFLEARQRAKMLNLAKMQAQVQAQQAQQQQNGNGNGVQAAGGGGGQGGGGGGGGAPFSPNVQNGQMQLKLPAHAAARLGAAAQQQQAGRA